MDRKTAANFQQELLDLYDYYVHGQIDRRVFLERAGKFAVGGLTAAAILEMLSPKYGQTLRSPERLCSLRMLWTVTATSVRLTPSRIARVAQMANVFMCRRPP